MTDDRLGEFEEIVLLAAGVLGSEASAVTIQDTLRERARREAVLGQIYATLDRLERKGFVRSEVRDATRPGERRKRFYDLTPEGHDALAESREVREALWRGLAATGAGGGGSEA